MGINHDFLVLDNGNLIINVFVPISDDLAARVQGGIPKSERQGRMWTSRLKEITREGEVVWQWDLADHLDPARDVLCPLCPRRVWGFINSLDLLPDGRVLFVMRLMNDIGIMDRSTGEITWRLGPGHELGHPHGASVLADGHILIFDNGLHRVGHDPGLSIADIAASRVVEFDPAERSIVWQYQDPLAPNFFSAICGGAQRLPNGNTLICEGTRGRLFEVTPEHDIVWTYQSPFTVPRPDYWGWTRSATIWQAHRYPPDYAGLAGRDLDPDRYEWVLRERPAKSGDSMPGLQSEGGDSRPMLSPGFASSSN